MAEQASSSISHVTSLKGQATDSGCYGNTDSRQQSITSRSSMSGSASAVLAGGDGVCIGGAATKNATKQHTGSLIKTQYSMEEAFSGMIADTEASMLGILSGLTMPGSESEDNSPCKPSRSLGNNSDVKASTESHRSANGPDVPTNHKPGQQQNSPCSTPANDTHQLPQTKENVSTPNDAHGFSTPNETIVTTNDTLSIHIEKTDKPNDTLSTPNENIVTPNDTMSTDFRTGATSNDKDNLSGEIDQNKTCSLPNNANSPIDRMVKANNNVTFVRDVDKPLNVVTDSVKSGEQNSQERVNLMQSSENVNSVQPCDNMVKPSVECKVTSENTSDSIKHLTETVNISVIANDNKIEDPAVVSAGEAGENTIVADNQSDTTCMLGSGKNQTDETNNPAKIPTEHTDKEKSNQEPENTNDNKGDEIQVQDATENCNGLPEINNDGRNPTEADDIGDDGESRKTVKDMTGNAADKSTEETIGIEESTHTDAEKVPCEHSANEGDDQTIPMKDLSIPTPALTEQEDMDYQIEENFSDQSEGSEECDMIGDAYSLVQPNQTSVDLAQGQSKVIAEGTDNVERGHGQSKVAGETNDTCDDSMNFNQNENCLMITNVISLSDSSAGQSTAEGIVGKIQSAGSIGLGNESDGSDIVGQDGNAISGTEKNNVTDSDTSQDVIGGNMSVTGEKNEQHRRKRKQSAQRVRQVTDVNLSGDIEFEDDFDETSTEQTGMPSSVQPNGSQDLQESRKLFTISLKSDSISQAENTVSPSNSASTVTNSTPTVTGLVDGIPATVPGLVGYLPAASIDGTSSTPVPSEQNTGQLPVIASTFSIKDLKTTGDTAAAIVPVAVKQEPPDVGGYGGTEKSAGVSKGSHKKVTAACHSGKRVLAPAVEPPHKLLMTKMLVTSPGVGQPSAEITRFSMPYTLVPTANKLNPSGIKLRPTSKVPSAAPISLVNGKPLSTCKVSTTTVVTCTTKAPTNATVTTKAVNMVKDISGAVAKKPEDAAQTKIQKLSSINIASVGVGRITDLIARKNPIPTHKATPYPQDMGFNEAKSRIIYHCYECGDSFHFLKSYDIHMGRCSMKLHYKCAACQTFLQFTNKCQLLNHLRSHLNIAKTQAVPIHIKSDSIEITSYYNEITPEKNFDWYKLNSSAMSSFNCVICGSIFANELEKKRHFGVLLSNKCKANFGCSQCTCRMFSACGFKAHRMLHDLVQYHKDGKLSTDCVEVRMLVNNLTCPDCGWHRELGPLEDIRKAISLYLHHIIHTCYHMSTMSRIRCKACTCVTSSPPLMANHLNRELEHYYKCELCPMALKSLKNLQNHFRAKHPLEVEILAKIIYRCHMCATLIDDRSFLLKHMDTHVAAMNAGVTIHYFCMVCGMVLDNKQALRVHSQNSHRKQVNNACPICRKNFCDSLQAIEHLFEKHMAVLPDMSNGPTSFCTYCGLLCPDRQVLVSHQCLGKLNQCKIFGERVENCSECGLGFHNTQAKIAHMKTHKPKVCERCGHDDFKTYAEFKSHIIYCEAVSKQQKIQEAKDAESGQTETGSSDTPEQKGGSRKPRKSSCEKLLDKPPKQEPADSDSEIMLTPKIKTPTKKRTTKKKIKATTKTVELNTDNVYTCDQCPAKFPRKSRLEVHMNSEHGLHPCHLCGVMHNTSLSLKRHLMIDHEGKRVQFYCLICRKRKIEKSFHYKSKLVKHLRAKHRVVNVDESKFVAEIPGLEGVPEKELSPQSPDMHSSPGSRSSKDEPPIKKLKVDGEKVYKCAKCLFSCEQKEEFNNHIAAHKTENTLQCLECGLCFSVLPSLSKHLFMVHKIRDFDKYMAENNIEAPPDASDSDVDIKRSFAGMNNRQESSSEDETSNPLECKVCYRQFDTEKLLKGHMRVHGMAFIKKSRRRSQGISPSKKAKLEEREEDRDTRRCEVVAQGTKTLVLKIKKHIPKPAAPVIDMEQPKQTETIKTETNTRSEDS